MEGMGLRGWGGGDEDRVEGMGLSEWGGGDGAEGMGQRGWGGGVKGLRGRTI